MYTSTCFGVVWAPRNGSLEPCQDGNVAALRGSSHVTWIHLLNSGVFCLIKYSFCHISDIGMSCLFFTAHSAFRNSKESVRILFLFYPVNPFGILSSNPDNLISGHILKFSDLFRHIYKISRIISGSP